MKPVNSVFKQVPRMNNYNQSLKKEIQQSINQSSIQYKQTKNPEIRTSTSILIKNQKFKTSKNSPERVKLSIDKKPQENSQNKIIKPIENEYFKQKFNNLIYENHLEESESALDYIKNKILKKKPFKKNENNLNFTNQLNINYSNINSVSKEKINENINLQNISRKNELKLSINKSNHGLDLDNKKGNSKVVSPRFEGFLKKYNEMNDKKIEKTMEQKKSLKYSAKIYTDSILKNENKYSIYNKLLQSKFTVNSSHQNNQQEILRESKILDNENKRLFYNGKNNATAIHSRKNSLDKNLFSVEKKKETTINLKQQSLKVIGSVVNLSNNNISNVSNGFKNISNNPQEIEVNKKEKPVENNKNNFLQNNYFKKESASLYKGHFKNSSVLIEKSQMIKIDENSFLNLDPSCNKNSEVNPPKSNNIFKNLSKSNSKNLENRNPELKNEIKKTNIDKLSDLNSVVMMPNNQFNLRHDSKKQCISNNSPRKYLNKDLKYDYSKEVIIHDNKQINNKEIIVRSDNNTKILTNNVNKKKTDELIKQGNNANISLKLDLKGILEKKNDRISNEKKEITEDFLETSNCSVKSSVRESNYYKKEAEKLSNYIKRNYAKNHEFPQTNVKFYKYGRLLGRGAFGKVNLGLHILSGRLIAIKSFNKLSLSSENSKKKIYYESNLMKNLRHNSIVRIYEIFETPKYIIMTLEYVCGGDLLSFVRKRSKLNELTSKFIFGQLIEALQYIHSQNIVHRDIKLDNILIDLSNNIKICDFGVSKLTKKSEIMHDQCGTPAYIAPEIIRNHGYEGFSCDIWSAGVVLYAMLSGTVPFKANNMEDLNKIILKGIYNPIKDISEDASHLLKCILEVDVKKRYTVDQILNHPWMKINDNNGKFMTKSNNTIKIVNLYTKAEKILLSKSNIDYRYADREDLIENFTLKNLDTKLDSENQNIQTKSNILAPFNSTLKRECSFLVKDLKIENDAIRIHGKAMELNRNYELNNNGEMDNGILINAEELNNSPLNLEEENNINSPFTTSLKNNNNNLLSKPVSPRGIESKRFSQLPSPKNESNRNKLKTVKELSEISSSNTLLLDENVIKCCENFGYKKDYLMKVIYTNEMNYASALYYLLINSKFE